MREVLWTHRSQAKELGGGVARWSLGCLAFHREEGTVPWRNDRGHIQK